MRVIIKDIKKEIEFLEVQDYTPIKIKNLNDGPIYEYEKWEATADGRVFYLYNYEDKKLITGKLIQIPKKYLIENKIRNV